MLAKTRNCLRNINDTRWKIQKGCIYTMNYPVSSGNQCTWFINYQANGSYNIEWTMVWWRSVVWPCPCDPKSNMDNFLFKVNQYSKFYNHHAKDHKTRVDNTWDENQQIDLDLWTCDLNINTGHLLSKGISCTKFGNFLSKESSDIELTIFFQRPAVWPWPLAMWSENY